MSDKLNATIYLKKEENHSLKSTYEIKYDESDFTGVLNIDIPGSAIDIYLELDTICVLKNLEIYSDIGMLSYKNLNGVNVDNLDVFTVENPKININLTEKNIKFLQIKFEIYGFSRKYLRLLTKISECINKCKEDSNKHQILTEQVSALIEYKQKYFDVFKEKEELQNKINELIELLEYKQKYFDVLRDKEELQNSFNSLQVQYNCIANSTCWKMTKPVRVFLDFLKHNVLTKSISKLNKSLKNEGLKNTYQKIRNKLTTKKENDISRINFLNDEEIEKQRNTVFSKDIKIGVIAAIGKCNEEYICDMIDSVLNQTYQNWELWLTTYGRNYNKDLDKAIKRFMKSDKRIKYKKSKNGTGIVESLNNIIKLSDGNYILILNENDTLAQNALFEVMNKICDENADFIYSDEDKFESNKKGYFDPYFKPDYSPDTLRTHNYISNFTVFNKDLLKTTGYFDVKYNSAYDYDLTLKLTENAKNIVHIPKLLYHMRFTENKKCDYIFPKQYDIEEAKEVINEHLKRIKKKAAVTETSFPNIYKINYKLLREPLISIIIPNKDKITYLKKCLDSIIQKTTYKNYEILIIENNSVEAQTFDYYKKLKSNSKVRVINYDKSAKYNFSAINNFAVKFAGGEILILLNNDTEVITPDWIQEMLMYVQDEKVGIAGAKLYYPNDAIQHVGVGVGLMGVAAHYFWGVDKNFNGYFGRMNCTQNIGAVTGACIMMRKNVYEKVNGLDEGLAIAYNDVDLCLKVRKEGYKVIFTPYAELYHAESITRGYAALSEETLKIDNEEARRFVERWRSILEKGDPYYSIHLPQNRFDFKIM